MKDVREALEKVIQGLCQFVETLCETLFHLLQPNVEAPLLP